MLRLGLLGEKLSHSLSPKIHKFLFDELNIEGNYSLFEIEKNMISNFLKKISKETTGINVTIPYKLEVMNSLDWISKEAKEIGAVNTIYFKENKKYGYNTDYFGFSRLLEQNNIQVKDKEIVILGAGGVARAVIVYLKNKMAKEIIIVARDLNKAKKNLKELLDKKVKVISFEDLEKINEKENKEGEILINCTPLGMYPEVEISPVSEKVSRNYGISIDLIYNPIETKFLKNAKKYNKKFINGMFMLVAQAIAAEEIWLNKKIENGIIEKISKKLNQDTNIILIGMPGCGKTYVGKKLSEKLDREFIDSDDYIEKKEGKKIQDLFLDGEDCFRKIETKAIAEISLKKGKIISTGGGVVKNYKNMEALKKNGIIFFLNRPLEKIVEEIDVNSRPLLFNNKEKIYSIYNERLEKYKKYSDYVVENKTYVEEVIGAIIKIMEN